MLKYLLYFNQHEALSFICFPFSEVILIFLSQVALVVKDPPANAGRHNRPQFNPWVGKIPGEGNGNPLQYSCLEIPMDRGAWRATVHSVTKSQTRLK